MKIYSLKSRVFVTVCLFKQFVRGAEYLRNSSHEGSICSTWKYRVYRGVVTNPGYTDEENGFCRCVAEGLALSMRFEVLYVMALNNKSPLDIKYWDKDYKKHHWPRKLLNETPVESNMLHVIDNARMLELTLTISEHVQMSLFRVVIEDKPEKKDEHHVHVFRMNCSRISDAYAHDDDNTDGTTQSSTKKPDQQSSTFCLPDNIVILGSACAGVCLVILIISIVVCCAMTKKRKKMVAPSFNPDLYDDAAMKPNSRNAISGVYSDAIDMRQKGPSVAASNNTYRQTDMVRRPVSVQYSNTMNTEPELYSNQQLLYSNQNEWT